jgi:hypothetical protein
MNPENILAKTPKGIAEIETRAHQLNPRLRQALVRVDGTKSLETLLAEAGAMGEALQGQLAELLANGFVLDATAAAARPSAPAPGFEANAPASAAPTALPASAIPADGLSATLPLVPNPELQRMAQLKASIRWLLAEAMGGAPSPLDLKLNHCRTTNELDKLIDEAFMPIQEAAGKPRAAHFWREAKALLKAAG